MKTLQRASMRTETCSAAAKTGLLPRYSTSRQAADIFRSSLILQVDADQSTDRRSCRHRGDFQLCRYNCPSLRSSGDALVGQMFLESSTDYYLHIFLNVSNVCTLLRQQIKSGKRMASHRKENFKRVLTAALLHIHILLLSI